MLLSLEYFQRPVNTKSSIANSRCHTPIPCSDGSTEHEYHLQYVPPHRISRMKATTNPLITTSLIQSDLQSKTQSKLPLQAHFTHARTHARTHIILQKQTSLKIHCTLPYLPSFLPAVAESQLQTNVISQYVQFNRVV